MQEDHTDVLVTGAGPVGLFTAVLLAECGIAVKIIDREERTATRSYACALHPHTLELLDRFGLAVTLLDRGRRIKTIAFYDGETRHAEIKFSELRGNFPFLLVLPQSALEEVLEQRLHQKAPSAIHWSHRLNGVQSDKESVVATLDRLGGTSTGYIIPHWETVVLKRSATRARFLVGADGHNSLLRERLGIEYEPVAERQAFAVFEFMSDTEVPDEVRIVLDKATTNVLWPLPGNRFRWTFQMTDPETSADFPEKERTTFRLTENRWDEGLRRWAQSLCRNRAPWFLPTIKEITWCTQVAFEPRLAKKFGLDRCWLAGDAAHQTGPVGMQSMNVGLCEAEALAATLRKILRQHGSMDLLAAYNRERHEEWRRLLGLSGGLKARNNTSAWVRERSGRLLPCIPASSEDLVRLADQLALDFP